jgi:hypothetical protein
MITPIGAILYSVLVGLLCSISTAFFYEKKRRMEVENNSELTGDEFMRQRDEILQLRTELARLNGISIGRECDAMQRRFIEQMSDNGQATVDLGRKNRRA